LRAIETLSKRALQNAATKLLGNLVAYCLALAAGLTDWSVLVGEQLMGQDSADDGADARLGHVLLRAHRVRLIIGIEVPSLDEVALLKMDAPDGACVWRRVAAEQALGITDPAADMAANKLSLSALQAWGVDAPGQEHSCTALFALHPESAAPAKLDTRLHLQLSAGARVRLGASETADTGLAVDILGIHLRCFASGIGHLEIDLAVAETSAAPASLARLLEMLIALDQALHLPKRFALAQWRGESLRSGLDRLRVVSKSSVDFLHGRNYCVVAATLAGKLAAADQRAWTCRLAHRHSSSYGLSAAALERVQWPFARLSELIAAEGAAQLIASPDPVQPSDYVQDYFTKTWPVSVLVPIALALHERQLLQRISDHTDAPLPGRITHPSHVAALEQLRDQLVCYRLLYRVVEISLHEHVQARFEVARTVFKLDAALATVESDLQAGSAQLSARLASQNQRRWGWVSMILGISAGFLALTQLVELTIKFVARFRMEALLAKAAVKADDAVEYAQLSQTAESWTLYLYPIALIVAVVSAILIGKRGGSQ